MGILHKPKKSFTYASAWFWSLLWSSWTHMPGDINIYRFLVQVENLTNTAEEANLAAAGMVTHLARITMVEAALVSEQVQRKTLTAALSTYLGATKFRKRAGKRDTGHDGKCARIEHPARCVWQTLRDETTFQWS